MIEILNVEVHFFAILIAMLVNIFIGAFWYSSVLFGKTWQKLVGMEGKEMKMSGKEYALSILVAFLSALGLNSVLQYSLELSGLAEIVTIFVTAFMISATLVIVPMLNEVVYEGRSLKLFALNWFHIFVSFLAMGLVLGIWV